MNRQPSVFVAVFLALPILGVLSFAAPPNNPLLTRFVVYPPDGVRFREVAVSPDGRLVAIVGSTNEVTHLWLRTLDNPRLSLVGGVDNPSSPFWSPDSQQIAFFADGKLQKLKLGEHTPVVLANVHAKETSPRPAGTWSRDDVIVYTDDDRMLRQLSARGGEPKSVLPNAAGTSQLWPAFLPDGRHFLYTVDRGTPEHRGVFVGSLGSPTAHRILDIPSRVSVVPPGDVMFLRGSTLEVQALDTRSWQLSGKPMPLAEGFAADHYGYPRFAASAGVLGYFAQPLTQLLWLDRQGKPLGPITAPGEDFNPSPSPDGRRLAFHRLDAQSRVPSIWTIELGTGIASQLTFDRTFGPSAMNPPIWSPDGRRIAYFTDRNGGAIYQRRVDGLGQEEELVKKEQLTKVRGNWHALSLCDWSNDGRLVLLGTLANFWIVPTSGDRTPFTLLQQVAESVADRVTFSGGPASRAIRGCARFSPDGRWVAYASMDGLYLASSEAGTEPIPLVKGRVSSPSWRSDGKELFYLSVFDEKLHAIPIDGDAIPRAGIPTTLFDMPSTSIRGEGSISRTEPLTYAAAADGQRFAVKTSLKEHDAVPVTLVLNWRGASKR